MFCADVRARAGCSPAPRVRPLQPNLQIAKAREPKIKFSKKVEVSKFAREFENQNKEKLHRNNCNNYSRHCNKSRIDKAGCLPMTILLVQYPYCNYRVSLPL